MTDDSSSLPRPSRHYPFFTSTDSGQGRIIRSMRRSDAGPTASYPMRVVQRLTGLPPDTIRAWERRYGAIRPKRSAGKTRHFSDEDVRRLILLRQAVDRGHRIGSIAKLSEAKLAELVDQERSFATAHHGTSGSADDGSDAAFEVLRQEYIAAIKRFDVPRASGLVTRASALLDREAFIYRVVSPTLREIGNAWEAGELSPAHEHLVSAQIRGLLDTLVRQHTALPGAPKVVVTTPPGENHEFGAVIGALLAATRGFQVIYLGPNLPFEDAVVAVEGSRAGLLVLGVQGAVRGKKLESLNEGLQWLTDHVETWVGLPEDHRARGLVSSVRYFTRFEEYDAALLERAVRHVDVT